jgi:3-isopropylmalate/(R)-2-methylmalate dehydratase small subunit
MIIKGKAHKFGDDINTDGIIAGKHLVSFEAQELGRHCLESIRPDFARRIKRGDIVVAGKNFGCGSSREHAPLALKGCGVAAVVAASFAAIFFRNAINIGLPFLELPDTGAIEEGDLLEIDLSGGIIKNLSREETYKTAPFPDFLQEIVGEGGLMSYIKKKTRGKK